MPTIQEVIQQYQAQLDARNIEAMTRLVESYKRAYSDLSKQQDALLLEIQAVRDRGEKVSAATINKLARYRELLRDTQAQLDKYAAIIEDEIRREAPGAVALGLDRAHDLVQSLFSGLAPEVQSQIMGTFQRLPAEAIEAMVGALWADSPLAGLLATFGTEAAAGIGDALIRGLLMGKGPRETAALLAREWGIPLARALAIARNEQLRAHRMASLAAYRANNHVVKGWAWHATEDTRTCMSCIAQHGSEHGLDETLDDHVQGRCCPIPITRTFAEMGLEGMEELEPVIQPGDGERWFEGLPEATQRQMMGPGKYEAWKGGRFDFAQLSKAVYDDRWGRSFVETPLKDLIGGQA